MLKEGVNSGEDPEYVRGLGYWVLQVVSNGYGAGKGKRDAGTPGETLKRPFNYFYSSLPPQEELGPGLGGVNW